MAFETAPAGELFVYCSKAAHHGDEEGPNRLQRAVLRVACNRASGGCGGGALVLRSGLSAAELQQQMPRGELFAMLRSEGEPMAAQCLDPACTAGAQATARPYLRCCEKQHGGDGKCGARSCDMDCAVLAQYVRAPAEDSACAVLGAASDDGCYFLFDPCGCLVSAEAFVMSVRTTVEGGQGSGRIAQSPRTGQYAFECPMGHAGSFVHDIHHYKCCGARAYSLIKRWAVEREHPEQPPPQPDAPAPPAPATPAEIALQRITEACSAGVVVPCPRCGVAGSKDGECVHVTCSNPDGGHVGQRYCYFCGKVRGEVAGFERCAESCGANGGIYMSRKQLPSGQQLSGDGFVAVHEFHVLRTTRLLREVLDDVGAATFRAALAADPGVLRGLCYHDGRDAEGDQAHAPVPGVEITVAAIEAYVPAGGMP